MVKDITSALADSTRSPHLRGGSAAPGAREARTCARRTNQRAAFTETPSALTYWPRVTKASANAESTPPVSALVVQAGLARLNTLVHPPLYAEIGRRCARYSEAGAAACMIDAALLGGGGEKEPWLAVNLALCLPGLGDWYAGSRAAGALQLGAALFLFAVGGWWAFAPGRNGAVGMILLLGTIPLWLFGAWSAYRACRARSTPEFEDLRRSQRDAWKAFFLSRFLPGLGQLYDGRRLGGALFLILFVLILPLRGPLSSALVGAVAAAAAVEAFMRSRGRPTTSGRTPWGIAAVVWVLLGGIPILTGWVRLNLVQALRIPSNSMAPALVTDDRILADMRARGRANVGDIVVLPFPGEPRQRFVKRAFALPGDLIEFRADGAYRNGRRVLDGAFSPPPGSTYGYGAEGSPYRVPEGAVFVLGDNAAQSNDSRYLGPFPLALVRGRIYKIYWPPARARTL